MRAPETGPSDDALRKGYQSATGHEPAQLDLFAAFQIARPKWTRAATLYDALPKYCFGTDAKARLSGYVAREDRVVQDGVTLRVTRTPGSVVRRGADGKMKAHGRWPGECEELVMRALRYLAVQHQASMSFWKHPDPERQAQIRVRFTLKQVRALLTEWGHPFNSRQIDEALTLLTDAKLTVAAEDGKERAVYSGALLAGYFSLEKEDDASQVRVAVLNPLETQAVLSGAYRALKIDRLMRLDDPVARRLFEIMVTQHRGADKPPATLAGEKPRPYEFMLSRLIEEGVVDPAKELRKTATRVRQALHTLALYGALWEHCPYQEQRRTDPTRGRRKIADVVWKVWPSAEVVSDIIAANAEAADARTAGELYGDRQPERVGHLRKRAQVHLD